MLIKNQEDLFGKDALKLDSYINGKLSNQNRGTLPEGARFALKLTLSRRLGDGGAVLRLTPDQSLIGDKEISEILAKNVFDSDFGFSENGYLDIPFDFQKTEGGEDTYMLEIKLPAGLYFWEILILRQERTLFVSSKNNVDFVLSEQSGRLFSLLVYKKRAEKDWAYGKTIYQIFPDRFYKGNTDVPIRSDAILSERFDGEITQYAEVAGGHVENNLFFGGTLWGIAEKLDYLCSLGVGIIYLNPIFEAYSNHKYDTADYERVDSMLGGDEALRNLIEKCGERGIKIVLDGVFNHTGSDSKYFNKNSKYDTLGAYNSEESPYHSWYNFFEYPDDYESWWGIKIHPRLNHNVEDCRRYFTGEGGICEKYLRMGIGGWRLDVADELSDIFLDEFSEKVNELGSALIIGEVWENAATKEAYGKRRRYFIDGQLDSVMNYPLRNAAIDFLTERNAERLYDTLTEIYSSYPKSTCNLLMNILGTHDTERIISRIASNIGACENIDMLSNSQKAKHTLSPDGYERAKKLLMLGSTLQFTVYGLPSVYYGDEAGLTGCSDPFCRKPFPWGREDGELLLHYKKLGKLRKNEKILQNGDFTPYLITEHALGFKRELLGERLLVLLSREKENIKLSLDGEYLDLLDQRVYNKEVTLERDSALVLKKK